MNNNKYCLNNIDHGLDPTLSFRIPGEQQILISNNCEGISHEFQVTFLVINKQTKHSTHTALR